MRFRARHPDGRQAIIALKDQATIKDLREAIKDKLEVSHFELKYGFPPQTLKLDDFTDDIALTAAEIKLNNESVQVIPPATTPTTTIPPSQSGPAAQKPSKVTSSTKAAAPSPPASDPRRETPEIPLPSESATLVLRVMPDDNSCLFRAISTAVSGDQDIDHVTKLRFHCADYISSNPDIYSKAILGKEPAQYCAWIQQESSWGGDIELDILSRVLGVEIDACIVDPFQMQKYNEGAPERVVLIYSGIHYDTVAVSPDPDGDIGGEFDMRRFPVEDSQYVIDAAKKLCEKLKGQGYMTNTSKFSIKCNKCGWKGKGERDASKHAMETGHMDMEEFK